MDNVKDMKTRYKVGYGVGSGLAVVGGALIARFGVGMMVQGSKQIVALVKKNKDA